MSGLELGAWDTETTGVDLWLDCRPFYASNCTESGLIRYWEWDVDVETRQPIVPEEDIEEITELQSLQHLVFHNPKFDIRGLGMLGVPRPSWERVEDTLLLSHVHSSSGSHGLKDLALYHLDILDDDQKALQKATNDARRIGKALGWAIGSEETMLKKPKDGWWVVDTWLPRAIAQYKKYPKTHPWWTVCRTYANRDVERTIAIYKYLLEIVKEDGFLEQYETRKKHLEISFKMEERGVSTYKPGMDKLEADFSSKGKSAETQCRRLISPKRLENPKVLTSSQQIAGIIYEDFKLPVLRLTKKAKAPAVDEVAFKQLMDEVLIKDTKEHRFITNLRDMRLYYKAVEYLVEYKARALSHRRYPYHVFLHPGFNPTGTDTTRYSCSAPNAQNISKKERINLRKIFGPAPGRIWYSMDYSNIELRIFAYASGDKDLIKAFESGASVHMIIAAILWPDEVAECQVQGIEFKKKYEDTLYQWVKNGNFALIYGAGVTKADNTYRQKGAYHRIRQEMPSIDEFMSAMHRQATQQGFVETLGGYPLVVPPHRPHVAVNYFVQGSAGWCIIEAMIRIHEYLNQLNMELGLNHPDDQYHMIMTVHDELVFDFPIHERNEWVVRDVATMMEMSGQRIDIPTPVEVEAHPVCWADGEKIKLGALAL
jgi:DNA polymerase I-like protein with 3'-5' exonuclease and polymerase domains